MTNAAPALIPESGNIAAAIEHHLRYSLGRRMQSATPYEMFRALALAIRPRIVDGRIAMDRAPARPVLHRSRLRPCRARLRSQWPLQSDVAGLEDADRRAARYSRRGAGRQHDQHPASVFGASLGNLRHSDLQQRRLSA